MIVYIGNKLLKHGYTPTTADTLGPALGELYDVVTVSDKKNKVLRMLDMLMTIRRNRKEAKLVLIDTYSTSNFYFALACGWLSKRLGIPYIPILHGGDLPKRIEKSKKTADFLFSNSAFNVAPSGYLKSAFGEAGYDTVYIPNTIDIEKYPLRVRAKLSPRLLYVRAFSKVYNPQMAIRTLARLLKKFSDAELCMVGPDKDGTLAEVQALAKELGVEDRVVFTGKLPKAEWIALSKTYDVFINTTNFDNTPVSVIEAMALGMGVVSTDVGGIPFLLDDGENALLVGKNDDEKMAEAVEMLLRDTNKAAAMTAAARKKAETFAWDAVKTKWQALIATTSEAADQPGKESR